MKIRINEKSLACWLLSLAGMLLNATPVAAAESYTERWQAFETRLIRKVKTFQDLPPLEPEFGTFKRIEYASDGTALPAYLDTRLVEPGKQKPAVVYLHGGFGLNTRELQVADFFAQAGIIALFPTWRGENGNPGYFEVFMGEVRDARAAVLWLAQQDYIDRDNIHVFGWSVGGGIAMNLAMLDDIPVRASGASAGVYDLELITAWATEDDYIVFPYDHRDYAENYFRLPIYHLEDLARPHTTWIGSEDRYAKVKALYDELYPDVDTDFELVELPGSHQETLMMAIKRFIELIVDD